MTYFNTGSSNFAVDKMKFYGDLLGGRSSLIAQKGYFNDNWDNGEYGWVNYDQSEGDLWLQLGAMLLSDLKPDRLNARDIQMLYHAALRGSYDYDEGNGITYSTTRYDMASQPSLKEAEQWVFQKSYGANKDYGYFKDDSSNQPVLVTAVTEKENYKNNQVGTHTIAAYFTNFRVFAIMPSEEGTNYVTEIIKDTVNSQSTTASTVKNLTSSTVTGSQTLSNSTSVTVGSSVSGSEEYAYSKGVKAGAEYGFTDLFKVSGELSFTSTQSFATGWGTSDTLNTSKDTTYSVSIPMPPYTQVMITQSDTTSVYLTSFNCPIAIKYDVMLVGYETGQYHNGIMHIDYAYPDVNRDAVYSFADPINGARGDLDDRIRSCEKWNDMDSQTIRWRYIMEHSPEQYDIYRAPESIETLRSHIPMSPTGASYTQTLNVVASEVSGLRATHPLSKIKITEPGSGIYTDEVSYQLFDYFTANMEVGDFSYANYLNLIGLNKYDVPFYGFSKDSGYWIITDKDGNELDQDNSPVKLEHDPVSLNWRYTAVKPGTCYLVYRIDEDAYAVADQPDQYIKNSDLKKTAALEIIVTEKDPTDTLVISGSYQGHINTDLESLEGDNKLTVSIYDETGKEIEKSYTWEARELKGISVTEDGQVSFTKDGTYHVRVVNGNQRSEWYEITAGHKPSEAVQENVSQPTCTQAGSCDLVTYCSVCGEELDREYTEEPAAGHSFDDGIVTQEPTVDKEGIMTYTCLNCGRTVNYSIPLTHTVTFDSNGAVDVPSQKVVHGKRAKEPEAPVSPMDGFVFAGWYPVKDGVPELDEFNFTTPITEDITLMARFGYDLGGAENCRVETLDGAPEIDEDNPYDFAENILTPDEIADNYGLVIISSPYSEEDVPAEDRDPLAARAAGIGAAPGTWFDISLYKMRDIWWGDPIEKLEEGQGTKLLSTTAPLNLMAEVPEELQKDGRTFYLLRCHDGEAEIIAEGQETEFSWKGDVFSTYLIAYRDDPVCPKDDSCPISPFSDTDKNEWYHNGVHWAIENGVMNGTSGSTFDPMTDTSRAMIVTMLWRMEGSPTVKDDVSFKDVKKDQWYTDAVKWAAANNIVKGYNDDIFGTDDPVTREQLAAILYRSAQAKGQGFNGKWSYLLNFDDADQVSDYASEALCWMHLNGIIQGMSDKELSPQGDAVRAQVATLLMRYSLKLQEN